VPVTLMTPTKQLEPSGDYAVAELNDLNEKAFINFFCPADFKSLVEAVIIVIPKVNNATANWDIASDYAAPGEGMATHSESDVASTYDVTLNQLFEVDISGILTDLAAKDYVGVTLLQGDAADNVNVVGVRFKYC